MILIFSVNTLTVVNGKNTYPIYNKTYKVLCLFRVQRTKNTVYTVYTDYKALKTAILRYFYVIEYVNAKDIKCLQIQKYYKNIVKSY